MNDDPERIREEIAHTRAQLGQDLDQLTEKVTPSKVVERRVDATREAVSSVKDKIMGTAGDSAGSVSGAASSAGSSVAGAASSATGAVTSAAQSAPIVAKQKAAGNPIAAGVVAFGLGWLVSGLVPSSTREQQGAGKLKEVAQSAAEPAKQALAQAASEVKENLAPAVQDAVESVTQTATDAAATVQEQAGQAGTQVKDQATGSASSVADTAKSAAQDAKEQAAGPADPEPTAFLVVEEPLMPYAEDPLATTDPLTSGSTYGDPPRENLRPPV